MNRSPLTTRGHLVPMGAAGTPPPPQTAARLNPQMNASLPYMEPGEVTRRGMDVNRVVEAGGNLLSQTLHPSFIPFEQLYRRLPEEGMFSPAVSPSNPFTFELGAFQVPARMVLMLYDLRPNLYRFSGVDPGDYAPIEANRFSSIMGFDITVDQKHVGQMSFQLDPVTIVRTSQQAFANNNQTHPQVNTTQQAINQAGSFASTAGMGNALQPQRPHRYGALSIPFTLVARSKQVVQTRCVVFRPIPTPIAFVEYDMAGVLVPELWFTDMMNAIKTPQSGDLDSNR